MAIDTHQTVGEIVVKFPRAAEVFEALHIDYCCKGARRLADACADAGLSPEAVVARLSAAMAESAGAFVDWSQRDAHAIVSHLLSTHHPYTRRALDRAGSLMRKVIAAHGEAHPEVSELGVALAALTDELLPHMAKEERVLFPYVLVMHDRRAAKLPLTPAPFGTVRNPVQMMNREHEAAGEILREIDGRTAGFTAPPHACATWRALYDQLRELTQDLHRHIHLETEVLFPLALSLEHGSSGHA